MLLERRTRFVPTRKSYTELTNARGVKWRRCVCAVAVNAAVYAAERSQLTVGAITRDCRGSCRSPAGSCMFAEIAGPNQSSMDLARRPSEVELNVTWTRYTSEMHMLVGAELAAHAAYIGTQGAGASAWPG